MYSDKEIMINEKKKCNVMLKILFIIHKSTNESNFGIK